MPVTSSWRIFSKLQKASSISGVGNLIAVGNFTSKWNVGVIWITSVSLGSFLLTSTLKLCRYFFRYQKPQSIWSKLLLKIQLHMKGGTNFKNLVLRAFLRGILQAIRLLTEAPPPAKHHVQLVTAESEQSWKSDLNILPSCTVYPSLSDVSACSFFNSPKHSFPLYFIYMLEVIFF